MFAIVQWGSPGALQFSHDVSLRKLICIFDGITCRLKITNRFIPSPKTQCGFSKCKEGKTSKVNAQFWSIIGREGELFFLQNWLLGIRRIRFFFLYEEVGIGAKRITTTSIVLSYLEDRRIDALFGYEMCCIIQGDPKQSSETSFEAHQGQTKQLNSPIIFFSVSLYGPPLPYQLPTNILCGLNPG